MQKVLHLVFAIVVVAGGAKFRFFFFVVSFKVFSRVAEFRARLKDRFVEVQKRRSKKHGLSSGGFQKLGMRFLTSSAEVDEENISLSIVAQFGSMTSDVA